MAGLTGLFVASCGTQKKLDAILYDNAPIPEIREAELPEIPIQRQRVMRDTVKFRDSSGKEWFLMKTMTDAETGEVMAGDVLNEAVVTARFRHVAERNGRVELRFQVIVPPTVMDSRWQVQLNPDMFALDDSLRLDPIFITGSKYREAQLKGYQQYEKLIGTIVTDPTAFLERRNLEIFLARNLPEVYALKSDSTYVSDERFATIYGVTAQEIVDHYSHKAKINRNERKKRRLTRMHDQLKSFLENEGIRLDTVIVDEHGTFTYNYVQTVKTRPGLKKVDIVLSGEVLEKGDVIFEIPRGEPYTFYISSTSSLADPREKYVTRVLERRVASNLTLHVDFRKGSSEIEDTLGNNARELGKARKLLEQLMKDEEFDLDSIIVTASCSPEGQLALNNRLSQERSEHMAQYFETYLDAIKNRFAADEPGIVYDEHGRRVAVAATRVPFVSRSISEDWRTLDLLIAADTTLTEADKMEFASYRSIKDIDRREYLMHQMRNYAYLKDSLYRHLRRVEFDFFLHRKGMVRDTVVTTQIDSVYMRGLEALDRTDYPMAANLLAPYKDYNTAVAFIGDDRNYGALEILSGMPATPSVHYLLAIVNARLGNQQEAVQHYMTACKMDRSFVHRGNLDPEISELIAVYGIHKEDE